MLIFNLLIYILFYRLDKSSLFCPAGKTISLFLWVEQTFQLLAGLSQHFNFFTNVYQILLQDRKSVV